jgi:hypothetical protein
VSGTHLPSQVEIGKIEVPRQPGQKKKSLQNSIFNGKRLGLVAHAPVNPATAGSINDRIRVQADWSKKRGPTSKITRAKRAGSMAQEGQCLPSKQEALSLNHSTIKKSNK